MEQWEIFELECVRYLNTTYGNKNIQFIPHGSKNSTLSDIEVLIDGYSEFFIESKYSPAQSGQFVLHPNDQTRSFDFSTANKSDLNEFVNIIISYMNYHYDYYKNVSTAGMDISLSNDIFANWIQHYYKSKKVKYVISNYGSEFVILPIEEFNTYFDIKCTFRRKKSGSSHLNSVNLDDAFNAVERLYPNSRIKIIDNCGYLFTLYDIPNKTKVESLKRRYQLNIVEKGIYKIKMLSNTNNPNVIFSIQLIKRQSDLHLKRFQSEFR